MARSISGDRAWRFVAILALCTATSALESDQPEFTFRSNSSEVRLVFCATDQNDQAVAGLHANDFAVVDREIVVRRFQSFARADWKSLKVALLIDNSASVSAQFRREIAEALELVPSTHGIADDNLSVFTYSTAKPLLLCVRGCSAPEAVRQMSSLSADELTPLFDTIVAAASSLSKGDAQTQKALIVFSDGEDTISESSLPDVIGAALKNEVAIYAFDLGSSASSHGAYVLYKLATETGGRYFLPRTDATRALRAIWSDFGATYIVSYRIPIHAPGFHHVQIFPTSNLNLRFRSRSGYYYDSTNQP
jgi:VWFA-related protein